MKDIPLSVRVVADRKLQDEIDRQIEAFAQHPKVDQEDKREQVRAKLRKVAENGTNEEAAQEHSEDSSLPRQ